MQTEQDESSSKGKTKCMPFKLEMPQKFPRQVDNETQSLTLPHLSDAATTNGALCQTNGAKDITSNVVEHENGAVKVENNSHHLSVDSKSELTSPSSPDSDNIQLQRGRRESELYEGDVSGQSENEQDVQSEVDEQGLDVTAKVEESDIRSGLREQEDKLRIHTGEDNDNGLEHT